jgi:putative membrane protein (TIGR04086 family)
MRKNEPERSRGKLVAALILGALLALGIELIVILIGSIAVSAGILKPDAGVQTAVAACVIGSFAGGCFACARWNRKRIFGGLLTGGICFLLVLLIALLTGGEIKLGGQALAECVGCLIGGGISGILAGGKKKKRRKGR